MSTRFPLLTVLLAALALAIAPFPGIAEALQFDASLAASEPWRWATGHLTHWTAGHLGWDVVGLLILGTVLERRSRRAWIATLTLGSLAVSGAVLVFETHLDTYRGLSGLDAALAVAVGVHAFRDGVRCNDWRQAGIAAVLLAALAAKVSLEVVTDTTLFVAPDPAFEPVPLAHLVGGVAGLVAGAAYSNRAKAAHVTAA